MKRELQLYLMVAGLMTSAATILASTPPQADIYSYYVPTRDGTQLSLDVALPGQRIAGQTFPVLIEQTRYWRASADRESGEPNPSLDKWDRAFLENGYVVVQVDVRGTGASFGSRKAEYSPPEVLDGWDVVEWIVHQPWSNGLVGAYGTSYTGTMSELLTATQHPAIKAVSPGWSDFESWRSPARPYGLYAEGLIQAWGHYVGMLDRNDPGVGGQVKRVDEDISGKLLQAAVQQHNSNTDVAASVSGLDFRDQNWPDSEYSFDDLSALHWQEQIEASDVPMLVFASWLDAGTAEGALWRFANFSNRQYVVILASNHGGGSHASPYVVSQQPVPPQPSLEEQVQLRIDFFDHYLKGEDNGVEQWPSVRYFNLGEERFLETEQWPPKGVEMSRMYLSVNGGLSLSAPSEDVGADTYEVDFNVSTGSSNRWLTQMGQPVLGLDDRGEMDKRMLTYTGSTLEASLQITGTPVVHLELSSSETDGAILVYLEDVDPDGRSRYLTEGGLRLLHRRVDTNPDFEAFGPVHSFSQKDALPMVPGETATIQFRMNPISVRIAAGHRIRLGIAGADEAIFQRLPATGNPILSVERNATHPSFIDIPIISQKP